MNGQNVYTSNVVYNDIRCKLKHDCTGGVIQKEFYNNCDNDYLKRANWCTVCRQKYEWVIPNDTS